MSAMTKLPAKWYFKMAWRDARKSKSRLLLFVSSITLGIAALVAINSFSSNLKDDINGQAKELLGADLELSSNEPNFNYSFLDTLNYQVSRENSFASMIYFPKSQESRLVDIRALEGDFPYYGIIETAPITAESSFRDGRKKALVDQSVMIQYGVNVGDTIRIGLVNFIVEGSLISSPSQSIGATLVAPAVYIPMKFLEETGLIQKGSRVNYRRFYKFTDLPNDFDWDEQIENDRDSLRANNIRTETIAERKQETGDTFENLADFLNLVAFVALLLGCVGVASAVHIYMKEKIKTVAILRCLGAKGIDAFIIFLIQMSIVGLIGAVIGALLGVFVQRILPLIFQNFLPVDVTLSLSWSSIFGGILTGLIISILFALAPLLSVRKASPLITLRSTAQKISITKDRLLWFVYLGIFLFILAFAFLQIGYLKDSLYFSFAVIIAFGFLGLVAKFFMWAVKKFFPDNASYIWRQGLANLYRPNNQTLVLIASIGLGTALITTLYFIQSLLINQVEITTDNDRPNLMVFDIQTYQKDAVADLTRANALPVLQEVPVVTMRIESINGINLERIIADSTLEMRTSPFRREWRVTYRDSLIESETLKSGLLHRDWVENSKSTSSMSDRPLVTTPRVSLEHDYAERNNLNIGDTIVWNVQGFPITTVLGSTREIDWERVQTNFLALFPSGVLEQAPQFHVLITRVPDKETGAKFQRAVIKQFPSVSVIDIGLILDTLDEILDKIAFVIRFMALFSIITGLLVLISSVILSKFQRIRESVLLRTMGGSKRQILFINGLEYLCLGSMASLSGILLSLLGSWGLAYYSFDSTFIPSLTPIIVVFLSITSLTILIGLSNSRGVLDRPPLEVLRSET